MQNRIECILHSSHLLSLNIFNIEDLKELLEVLEIYSTTIKFRLAVSFQTLIHNCMAAVDSVVVLF